MDCAAGLRTRSAGIRCHSRGQSIKEPASRCWPTQLSSKGGTDSREFLREDTQAIKRIEAYMDSCNYVPLEDNKQMKMTLKTVHREVATPIVATSKVVRVEDDPVLCPCATLLSSFSSGSRAIGSKECGVVTRNQPRHGRARDAPSVTRRPYHRACCPVRSIQPSASRVSNRFGVPHVHE